MEITINIDGQALSVEVTVEVYEHLDRADHKEENLVHTTTTEPAKDAPALVKKIGRTTYIMRVHFSKTSKETMSDKIKCMLKNEI